MKHTIEDIKASAAVEGLNDIETSRLINMMASSAIEGFDSLSIEENIKVFKEGKSRVSSGEAAALVKERMKKG